MRSNISNRAPTKQSSSQKQSISRAEHKQSRVADRQKQSMSRTEHQQRSVAEYLKNRGWIAVIVGYARMC
jgi:hypothetical protein